MKKHIFGFAIFSIIFASFALVYAFFYAPSIPPKEAVKPPLAPTETREVKPYSCYPKRIKEKDFSYYVVNSSYFKPENKFVSKIILYWNGKGEAPKQISIRPRIFTMENYENAQVLMEKTLVEPFKEGNSKTITVESNFVLSGLGTAQPNLYVAFDVLDGANGSYLTNENVGLAGAHQVLLVYGNSPVVKKSILRGTAVPQ